MAMIQVARQSLILKRSSWSSESKNAAEARLVCVKYGGLDPRPSSSACLAGDPVLRADGGG